MSILYLFIGQALCEGFNNMGYKLNKPTLRAQMEYDCNRIAKGSLIYVCSECNMIIYVLF